MLLAYTVNILYFNNCLQYMDSCECGDGQTLDTLPWIINPSLSLCKSSQKYQQREPKLTVSLSHTSCESGDEEKPVFSHFSHKQFCPDESVQIVLNPLWQWHIFMIYIAEKQCKNVLYNRIKSANMMLYTVKREKKAFYSSAEHHITSNHENKRREKSNQHITNCIKSAKHKMKWTFKRMDRGVQVVDIEQASLKQLKAKVSTVKNGRALFNFKYPPFLTTLTHFQSSFITF